MDVLYLTELIGTAVFAVSGALAGIRYRMDMGGVVILGFIVGNGGGTLRDIILARGAVFWMTDKAFIVWAVVPAMFTFVVAGYCLRNELNKTLGETNIKYLTNGLVIADALGLGLFAAVASQVTLDKGFDVVVSVIMAMITCTGGGIMRDLLCNEIPLVFCREIYMTAALCGAIVYVVSLSLGLQGMTAIFLCLAVTTTMRLVSYFRNFHFPVVG